VMVGVLLLAAGAIRAGWVADLLSVPVTAGFLAGISVHIGIRQLPALLGIDASGETIFGLLRAVWTELPQLNPIVLLLGAGVFGVSVLGARMAPRFPGALLAVVASAVAVASFGLQARGVGVLGAVPAHIPWLGIPPASDMRALAQLAPLAFTVAMVCMMQTAAVVREFPSTPDKDEHVSPSFFGVGLGCILSGVLGAFPVNASPPSTAMMQAAGARSQAAGLFAVGAVILLVVFFGSLLAYVPQAALAGVLLTVAVRIFRLNEIHEIFRQSPGEFAIVVIAAILVIALPTENGMLLAIVLSLFHSLFIIARPQTNELARAPGTTVWWPPEHGQAGEHVPGVLVFAPSAPINFTNARFVCRQLREMASARPGLRLVVIEASGVTDIDFTGAQVVIQTVRELQADGIDVALARLSAERAHLQAVRTGLLQAVGADHVFLSVEDAVRALGPKTEAKGPLSPRG
jgi:SulP family sulfate permease